MSFVIDTVLTREVVANKNLNFNISLSWTNLQVNASVWEFNKCSSSNNNKNYSSFFSKVPKRTKKIILPLLNGHFNLHSLNGLLGPSGAGKTTLLNCLSGRSRPNQGVIKFTPSQTSSQECSTPSIVFIEQNSHESSLIKELTVGQILKYAYCFKNGQSSFFLFDQNKNKKAFKTKIQEVLQAMMLSTDILQRKYSKCSGGEQRRVALAQELLIEKHLSDYWFIDEPTSGLDSQSALVVMQCLKRLAQIHPITIVASIHVPNEQTLALFDRLIILAKRGLCIYSGSPFSLESTLENKIGLKVAAHQKPIEAAIAVAFDASADGKVYRQTLANDVLQEEFSLLNHHQLSMTSSNTQSTSPSFDGRFFRLVDLRTHFSRQFLKTFIADWKTFSYQLLFYVGSILFLASVFDHAMVLPNGCLTKISNLTYLNDEDEDEFYNVFNFSTKFCDATPLSEKLLIVENINYLCFGRIFQAFPLMINSIAAFSSLARVFKSEHRNKWYSLSSFYWATSLLSLIEMTLVVGIISSVIYIAGGEMAIDGGSLNWHRFGHFSFSLWIYYLYHQSGGQLIGILLLNHLNLAIAVGYLVTPVVNILDDYFFKVDDYGNPVFVALSEIVAFKYTTRYMLYAFYGIDRCETSFSNDGSSTSKSWMLEKHHIDPEALPFYIWRILVNVFILRVVTLVIMYAKFGSVFENLAKTFCFKKKKIENITENNKFELKLFAETDEQFGTENLVVGSSKQEKSVIDENNNAIVISNLKERFDNHEDNKPSILIAWQQLTLHREAFFFNNGNCKRSSKPIFQNLNGHLSFGTLTALIGMSGAGKTSLLRVLNGQLSGSSRLEGHFRVSTCQKVRTCFIAQEVNAHILPGLTVRQTLVYASRLKNAVYKKENKGEKEENFHQTVATNLLEELGLLDAADTAVQRCSGGELRRLSIAVELTSSEEMPNLMCADEPTTGLDSTSAAMIITTLHRISRLHNIAILASVHQPSPELLATAFDQVYVLASGGACAYFGPPQGIASHLSRVATIDQTESRYPIEVLVRYSCLGVDHPTVQQLVKETTILNVESNYPETILVYEAPRSPRIRFSLISTILLLRRYLLYFTGYLWVQGVGFFICYAFWTLVLRHFFDPSIAKVDGCFSLEDDYSTSSNVCQFSTNETAKRVVTERGLENNLKYNLFLNNGFNALVTLQTSIFFFVDLQVFVTEHRNGWYSSGAFYLSKIVTETVPAALLLPLYVYTCDIYSEHLSKTIYWALLGTFGLAVFAAQGLAHMIVLLAPRSLSTVVLINIFSLVFSFLLSNIPVTVNRMHYVYQLVAGFSFSRFSSEASFLLEYGFDRCKEGQLQMILMWMGLGGENPSNHYYDLYRCWLALLANGVLYRLIAVWMLVRLANPNTKRKGYHEDQEKIIT